ncbi:MAG: mannose-1-phosphate guanylyltransferase [Sphingobacteriales bacterium 17-39-43]|uniref:mannose-1-phosphate guanylyltransferase n=1 Tax=Daejeonella sp. TaxID=2805397 RepID=UPI000BDB868F|nr:mannose-1-phosphate guanylyltransferase [Daejeonella sp.]OYZ33062.1 MAG: mannose-1-phosphate guanylyltransferase [Sphingobacteriales bacterium 16-39-50]OZA26471.1 MAG: mannose-1-phosphate guanylyltransferase [Sphingobacteriales bacterium 17-39-43]HQT21612.1 mannose-1-phosphate guanylyltransferase [Daejeonella sp.]HQT56343.1 mannose-1-phosphate guanylyltransferase [Daejeonella sp.]
MKNYYALIMAGGIGSRFWPISRTAHPKQFIDILGTGKTLIQQTYDRFLKIVPKENIFILTNESYIQLVREQLPDLNDSQILAEPIMRNTAPCIAYGSHKILKLNPEASIVVAPSDHLIMDSEEFTRCIKKSLETAATHDCLISLGIKPSRPDTGYGYIQYNTKKIGDDFFMVKTFTEKPNKELAKTFVQSGDFLWNAGIFVWSVKSILNAFKKYLPEMNDIFREGEAIYNTPEEQEFVHTAFSQCTNLSIDYGIMEKAENVYVLPSEFGWSDLGTWASVYDLSEKDYVGNAVIPSEMVIMYDSSNCMVNVPKGKLVIMQGLHDFIVVEDNNTLLICPRSEEQEIKQIVGDVKQRFGPEFI